MQACPRCKTPMIETITTGASARYVAWSCPGCRYRPPGEQLVGSAPRGVLWPGSVTDGAETTTDHDDEVSVR